MMQMMMNSNKTKLNEWMMFLFKLVLVNTVFVSFC
jgi:hypothetical protein